MFILTQRLVEKPNSSMYKRLKGHWMNCSSKRSMLIESNWDLGDAMKRLNDQKEFEKALQLFDQYKEQKKKVFRISNYLINQALKASTGIGDLKRGLAIDQLIPLKMKNDPYIIASLIHLTSN